MKYNIYTDLGTLVAENVSRDEAFEYLYKGVTEDLHFCYFVEKVPEIGSEKD